MARDGAATSRCRWPPTTGRASPAWSAAAPCGGSSRPAAAPTTARAANDDPRQVSPGKELQSPAMVDTEPLLQPLLTDLRFKPCVLGVAGGTGSGKTTVARAIVEAVGADRITLIEQDSYYS